MIARRTALFAALLVVASCGSSPDDGPRPDVRAELPAFGYGGTLTAVGDALYVQSKEGVWDFSPGTEGLRQILDQSYRACPWTNTWKLGPFDRDDVKITYGPGGAYFFQPLCGLWRASLQEPSRVTPILLYRSSEDAAWVDGTPARVSPTFDVTAVPDGEGLLVCSTGEGGAGTQLWSVSRDGKAGEMVGKVDGIGCTEVVPDDSGAFLSLGVGGVHRWDRRSRAVTPIATPRRGRAESLQATATHLFYVDGDQIMRVGRDGNGLTRIERAPSDYAYLTKLIADDRNLYVATQQKIVRVPQTGGRAETLLVAASDSRVATEHGFVKVGDDLWFVLRRLDGKPYLARVPM